jgi:hypothetical protein
MYANSRTSSHPPVSLDGGQEQSKNTDIAHEPHGAGPVNVASHAADLFRHVSADKAAFYRCIMDVFAAAKRQYRLQLRPDEVLGEAAWPGPPPRLEEVNAGN